MEEVFVKKYKLIDPKGLFVSSTPKYITDSGFNPVAYVKHMEAKKEEYGKGGLSFEPGPSPFGSQGIKVSSEISYKADILGALFESIKDKCGGKTMQRLTPIQAKEVKVDVVSKVSTKDKIVTFDQIPYPDIAQGVLDEITDSVESKPKPDKWYNGVGIDAYRNPVGIVVTDIDSKKEGPTVYSVIGGEKRKIQKSDLIGQTVTELWIDGKFQKVGLGNTSISNEDIVSLFHSKKYNVSFKIGDNYYICEATDKALHNPDGSLVKYERDFSDIEPEFNKLYNKRITNRPSGIPTPYHGNELWQDLDNSQLVSPIANFKH